jgi:hypothetical protein
MHTMRFQGEIWQIIDFLCDLLLLLDRLPIRRTSSLAARCLWEWRTLEIG